MRRMGATVTLVTTSHGDARFGMTATAVTSVSAEPPSLLVCINDTASIRMPLAMRGAFCVNLLGEGHENLCRAFSGGRAGEERFEVGEWRERDAIPYLADAQANLFCEVDGEMSYATHTIFVGRVVDILIGARLAPLVHLDGRLHGALASADGERRQ